MNFMRMANEELIRHWLLNIAIEFPRALDLLFPSIDAEALNVREIPGAEPRDYASCLADLADDRLIGFASTVPGYDLGSASGISEVLARSLRGEDRSAARRLRRDRRGSAKPALDSDEPQHSVTYSLTSLGGEAWEYVAKPKWGDFVYELVDEDSGEVISPNPNLLMARMGWFSELNKKQIIRSTISVQRRLDFQALYWKNLPEVYQARFLLERAPATRSTTEVRLEHQWFEEWRRDVLRWYAKPWELSSWPVE